MKRDIVKTMNEGRYIGDGRDKSAPTIDLEDYYCMTIWCDKETAIDNIWLLHLHCHDERHAKLAETEKQRKQLADAGINIP